MIYNLPQATMSKNNNQQNFGFSIRVLEGDNLLKMAEAKTFRFIEESAIKTLEEKAGRYLPDQLVILKPEMKNPMPYESYDVDVFRGGEKVEELVGNYPREIMAFLRKLVNPQTKIHSKVFYDGQKSPESIAKSEKFQQSFYKHTKKPD